MTFFCQFSAFTFGAVFSGKSFIAVRCKKLHSDAKNSKGLRAKNMKLAITTKQIALIAVFSALYSVIRLIPMGPMIGLSTTFSVADCLAPVYGIVLGPFTGGASIIVGTFLSMAFGKPVTFMGLDFLPAFVNAVAIGFLIRKKWIPAIILNVALLAVFIANPLTTQFFNIPIGGSTITVPFYWLHIVALAVLISPLGYKAGSWVKTLKPVYLTAGVAILAFIGTMMQHLTGNILTEVVRTQILGITTPDALRTIIWPGAFIVYPWERLTLVILAVIVGVPLVKALKTTMFPFEDKQPTIVKQNSADKATTENKEK